MMLDIKNANQMQDVFFLSFGRLSKTPTIDAISPSLSQNQVTYTAMRQDDICVLSLLALMWPPVLVHAII